MRYHLTAAAYDVPGESATPVRSSYLLCSNPRSGSSLLSEALHGLGRLGTPIEYFDRSAAFADLFERWGCADLDGYVACLQRHRTTADGVLGAKLHWYQLAELAAELAPPPLPGACGRERAVVARLFPNCRYVVVRRSDRDRQAVSWAIAEQTARWGDRGDHDDAVEPSYDYAMIADCRRRVDEGEAGWQRFFRAAGVEPYQVAYEDLERRYAETVAAVARYLGARVSASDVPPPRLRRQADGRSEAMLARYCRQRDGTEGS